MKIAWSGIAEARVREAVEIERRERAPGAFQWLQRLLQTVRTLEFQARYGYVVPELNRPRLAQLVYDRYRIVYRVERAQVTVLTVLAIRGRFKERLHAERRDRHHRGAMLARTLPSR